MLPLLYAICGAAQGVAGQLALAAARGDARTGAIDPAVLAEARREHLWRLLLDWPQALGLSPQRELFVAARKRAGADDFCEWALQDLSEHFARVEAALTSQAEMALGEDPWLPPLTAAQTVDAWPRLDAAWAAMPVWRGAPASTGALARHPELAGGSPILARAAARAADLIDSAGLGIASSATVAAGVGRAAVETARGLLLHEIVLDGDSVADYTIVAPTEWNFHPAGALAQLLQRMAGGDDDEFRIAAERAMLAWDPCVRWEIEAAE